MKFLVPMLSFIVSAAAAPGYCIRSPPPTNSITIGKAVDACGNNLELKCCNDVDESVDTQSNSGVFSGLIGTLGGVLNHDHLGIFDQCSSLSVTALIGVDHLLNNHCKQRVACCQHSPATTSGGLVNLGLPCIALSGLL